MENLNDITSEASPQTLGWRPEASKSVVKGIISVAKELGYRTVAEGVDTEDTLDALAALD